jgi:hypothetical protein
LDERRAVDKVRDDSTIVGFEKAFENQAGEQLMLRELPRTIAM